jgi:hypothetical protein
LEKTTGFVFQQSYYESVRMLGDADRLAALDALLEYVFAGVIPGDDMPPMSLMWFTMARPTVDASTKRYASAIANGKKGGRKPKQKEDAIPVKPKSNLNSNKDKNMDINIVSPALQRGETYRSRYDENGELVELEF